jgi:hypothetical protein
MNPLDDEKRLGEMIAKAAPGPRPVADFAQWKQAHPEAMNALLLQAGPSPRSRSFLLTALLTSRAARIAAGLALALGLGFATGRLSSGQRIDAQRLAAEVQTSVLAAVDQRLRVALEEHSDQIKEEMARQVRADLARFATQTLAIQDRKIDDLTQSIAAVRSIDRQRIVTALEQIEMNRLGDRAQLASSLQALALQGSQTAPRPSN